MNASSGSGWLPFRPREASWATIGLFLLVQPLLLVALLGSQDGVWRPLARTTQWLLHPDLIGGLLLLLIVVGGVVMRLGGLRASDVGLIRAHLPVALLGTGAIWLLTQLVLVIASLSRTGRIEPHPTWDFPGPVPTLSFLLAMLVGMALYEEVAIRGFLFPQLALKLGAGAGAIVLAAALSAIYFALLHIPTRMLMAQVTGAALIPHLLTLTGAGLVGVILYLRTGNLLLVTGIHALVNAPTPLVAAAVSPFAVTALLSVLLWVVWPRLAGARAVPESVRADRPALEAVPNVGLRSGPR